MKLKMILFTGEILSLCMILSLLLLYVLLILFTIYHTKYDLATLTAFGHCEVDFYMGCRKTKQNWRRTIV